MSMNRFIAFAIASAAAVIPSRALAQLAYQGINEEGKAYKIFIYQKFSTGPGRWTFQTKTVGGIHDKPYYSSWEEADCAISTVDGKVVTAIPYGTEYGGQVSVLQAVCGFK